MDGRNKKNIVRMAAMKMQKIIKALCPPIIFRQLSRIWHSSQGLTFAGHYPSWADAKRDSSGYDAANILEQVKNAALKVKRGEALFERDSVCFNAADNRYPALTGLLYIALKHKGQLSVLDFGGSLASFYSQHINILNSIEKLRWGVIEQPHFVAWGVKHLTTASLGFYHSAAEFTAEGTPNVVFLSSVLQYLEAPYDTFNDLLQLNTEYILLDRTAFIDGNVDRLTVQTVPASIYQAKYPAWFMSWEKFHSTITAANYEVIMEFPGTDHTNIGYYKGLLLQRKNRA
jgi:putative methyltransferase (TIGR04325 family)